MYKKISVFIVVTVLCSICILKLNSIYKINYVKENYSNINSKEIWVLDIPKIGLKEIVNIADIKSNKINGVVLFNNYGRPNKKYSNTIIGAHSGTGWNAYFNNIYKLIFGDEIIIYYNAVVYKYKVINNYDTDETDLTPLNKIEKRTTITLITCMSNNRKKRVIVVAELL